MKAILSVFAILIALISTSCERKSSTPALKDFSHYLHLKSGTTIQITHHVDVKGNGPELVMRQIERELNKKTTTGILVHIDRFNLMLREMNSSREDPGVHFSPEEINQIKMMPSLSKP